ncbi:MAG: hypothetical protein KDB00_10855 [Planctomycetales bacterium]|nr:hypothetical protein [Planctomycetales bacterium]
MNQNDRMFIAQTEPGLSGMRWADFGLAGLVIGALFVVLFWLLRWVSAEMSRQRDRDAAERSELIAANKAIGDRLAERLTRLEIVLSQIVDAVKSR